MSKYNKQQSGIALIIGLVMLLLLTIIMIAAVQVTVLEERMAGNLQNNNIAFQSAESALREAEILIGSGAADFNPLKLTGGPFQNIESVCVAGLCGTTSPLQSEDFPDDGTATATTGIENVVAEPEYIIELVRIDPSVDSSRLYATFRITARASGADSSSSVQLQSTYRLHALSFTY